jgi:hypothetical protein
LGTTLTRNPEHGIESAGLYIAKALLTGLRGNLIQPSEENRT